MSKHIIITSCTKNKSTQFKPNVRSVSTKDYLATHDAIDRLNSTRSAVFRDPTSAYNPQATQHYAFYLYVRHCETQLYRPLRDEGLAVPVRERLLDHTNDVEWYFLSGGYGLVHALELERPYQATFNKQIATKNNIPWTLPEWKRVLPALLDEVFERTTPSSVSVFGSKDYVDVVRAMKHYRDQPALFKIRSGRANEQKLTAGLLDTVRRLFHL
jgi:cytoplasmic iron level regulating protein YaaA (DUF328/UPF0246 family)